MPGGNLTIIGLCVAGGLLVVLGVIGIVTKVRRAFRNSILGQIYNGVKNEVSEGKVGPEDFSMKQELATLKSVSDLSTALIPRINKDFPDLSVSQMQSAAQAVLVKSLDLLMAMTTGNNGDTIDRIQTELAACGIGLVYPFTQVHGVCQLTAFLKECLVFVNFHIWKAFKLKP